MPKTARKVVLVGSGAVGTSFLYSAVNQGIASEYVIIDLFEDVAKGNAIDIEDGIPHIVHNATVKQGGYEECADADVIVITAGRPQKEGETRLDLVASNAQIMKGIINSINATGFDGVIIIASNPCDVLTQVAIEVSNLDSRRIISSGTNLDSGRLAQQLAKHFNVAPHSIASLIIGEHGDSSLPVWSHATVGGKNIMDIVAEGKITEEELATYFEEAKNAAYKIIQLKRATYYGIGMSLARIAKAVLNDENVILPLGTYLKGEYGINDAVVPVPTLVGEHGAERVVELKLNAEEQIKLTNSANTIKEYFTSIEL